MSLGRCPTRWRSRRTVDLAGAGRLGSEGLRSFEPAFELALAAKVA